MIRAEKRLTLTLHVAFADVWVSRKGRDGLGACHRGNSQILCTEKNHTNKRAYPGRTGNKMKIGQAVTLWKSHPSTG